MDNRSTLETHSTQKKCVRTYSKDINAVQTLGVLCYAVLNLAAMSMTIYFRYHFQDVYSAEILTDTITRLVIFFAKGINRLSFVSSSVQNTIFVGRQNRQ